MTHSANFVDGLPGPRIIASSRLTVDVPDTSAVKHFTIELPRTNMLHRAGWRSNLIKARTN